CLAAFFHIGDFGLQIAVTHGAFHDILADHKGRGAIDLQRLGKVFGFTDSGNYAWVGGIPFELLHVGTKLLGGGKRFRFAGMARAEKLLVKLPEFVALKLTQGSIGNFCRLAGIGRENWKVAQDNAQIRIFFHEPHEIAQSPFAITAIIVEEFDKCDLAARCANHRLARGPKELFFRTGNELLALFRKCGGLARLQDTHRFAKDLRVSEQIILENRLYFSFLIDRKAFRKSRRRRKRTKRERQQPSLAACTPTHAPTEQATKGRVKARRFSYKAFVEHT